MSDDKKIFVDDDWKAEARREKERLAQQEQKRPERDEMPAVSFIELVNLLTMQALAGLGLMATQGGERIPPNLELAKHFIDMLQMLEDKTRNNLNAEEKKLLDTTLYELRMQFVQRVGGGGLGAAGAMGGMAGPAGGAPRPGIFGE